jgi:hypothetical protein
VEHGAKPSWDLDCQSLQSLNTHNLGRIVGRYWQYPFEELQRHLALVEWVVFGESLAICSLLAIYEEEFLSWVIIFTSLNHMYYAQL